MILIIASGINTVGHVDFIVRTFLGVMAGYISFALLSNDIIDETFLRLEVVAHRLRFVRSISVLKHRTACFYPGSIDYTTCINGTTIHVHGNNARSKFYILIVYFTATIQMRQTAFCEDD